MISIAWRNLSHDKFRFAVSLSGVAFSVFLILILLGLFRGWNVKIVRYIDNTPADLWVLQKGGDDFFNATSFLPTTLQELIESVDNVREVHPLVGRQVTFELEDEFKIIYIVGFDTEKKVGGPFKIVEGETIPKRGEVIIDKVFSSTKKIRIGDTMRVLDTDLKVVGVAEGGDLVFVQFAFVSLEQARELFDLEGLVNFYLVRVNDFSKLEETASGIESQDKLITAMPRATFRKNNQRDINDIFIPILTVLVFIGFIVGLTIVGLMSYTATIENAREYGILKAVGVSNRFLYKTIFQQGVTIGVLGFILGAIISFVSSLFLEDMVPQFALSFIPRDVALTFLLIICMSILSSFIPIRRIASIDPATVFKL